MAYRKYSSWAAGLIALLFVFALATIGVRLFTSLLQDVPQFRSPSVEFDDRPTGLVQAIYQTEAEAAHTGWTPELHDKAGRLYRSLGDLPSVTAHWEAAQSTDKSSLERLAQTYIELQWWSEAIDTLNRLLTVDPHSDWAHYQLALAQTALDPIAADKHIRAVIENPDFAPIANDLYNIVIDDPTYPLISMRVGLVLATHEVWPQAELAFRQAAMIGHPYPEALAYSGLARTNQGKDGSAWMDLAFVLGGEVAQVYYLYGLNLRHLNEYEQSRDAFIQAAALDPNNPAYYAELGIANSLLFDFEHAERWLNMAVSISNNAPGFLEMLAGFYAETGYTSSITSQDLVQQLAPYIPDDPDGLAGYGWTLYGAGDTAGALTRIDAALDLMPDNPDALYYKASILLDVGLAEQALPILEQLLILDSLYIDWAGDMLSTLRSDSDE